MWWRTTGLVHREGRLTHTVWSLREEPELRLATTVRMGYLISMCFCIFLNNSAWYMRVHLLRGSGGRPWLSRGSPGTLLSLLTEPSWQMETVYRPKGPAWPNKPYTQVQAVPFSSPCIPSSSTWFSFLYQLLLTLAVGSAFPGCLILSLKQAHLLPGIPPWSVRSQFAVLYVQFWCKPEASDVLFSVLFAWEKEASGWESYSHRPCWLYFCCHCKSHQRWRKVDEMKSHHPIPDSPRLEFQL